MSRVIMDTFNGHRVLLCFIFYLGYVAGSGCELAQRSSGLEACLISQDSDDAACSVAGMVTAIDTCLTDIKAAFMNTDTFWFGNAYETNCPQGPVAGVVECANTSPEKKDSIGTRTGAVYENIDRYLKVVYTSTPGEYYGCGNTYKFTDVWTKEIDPLTPDPVRPWHVRHLPDLEWKYTPGDLYTLLIYDVGYDNMHGVYVNIVGNNMVTAQTVKAYRGPLITTTQHNPYLFMIMRQSGMLELPQEWTNRIEDPSAQYTIPEMMTDLNFTGPIAVNWVVAIGDAYAMELMLDRQYLNMCPNLVAEVMDSMSRPFLPRSASLDVWLNVTFTPGAMAYTVCCTHYAYPTRAFTLNPLGDHLYKSVEVRSNASLDISFLKKGYFSQASNFTGELYTLYAVDPDVPVATVGTESLPLLHYLVMNIPDGDVTQGDVIQAYSGPTPPDTVHTYYFLLYKQSSVLANNLPSQFAGSCQGGLAGRCLYDINSAVADMNLTLVGATWMQSDRDDYVIYRYIDRGETESVECQGQTGYHDPCPTQGASRSTISMFSLVVFLCITMM